MVKYSRVSGNVITELDFDEIEYVDGGALTAGEVVASGALAIRVGMTVAAVNPVAGAVIAAAGATAVLFGSLASGL